QHSFLTGLPTDIGAIWVIWHSDTCQVNILRHFSKRSTRNHPGNFKGVLIDSIHGARVAAFDNVLKKCKSDRSPLPRRTNDRNGFWTQQFSHRLSLCTVLTRFHTSSDP